MTAVPVDHVPDYAWPVAEVESAAAAVLDEAAARMASAGPPAELVDVLREALAQGGKRLRPAFCHWGYVSAAGRTPKGDGHRLGAALELLHTFALIHDDVMDGSATRRGGRSVHARYAARHRFARMSGESRRYAEGMAVLVGDLAFALANEVMGAFPGRVQQIWYEMCRELVLGQYLDVHGAATGSRCSTYAARVAVLKSGRYTVVRPLQLGAALAGAGPSTLEALAAYGEPLGEAFQLCDDLLGTFGDPAETGKPVGADFRDGKPTVLLALTVERAPASARPLLDRVGSAELTDDEVADLAELAVRTGARREVEARIANAVRRAGLATEDAALHVAARPALRALAERAACRIK